MNPNKIHCEYCGKFYSSLQFEICPICHNANSSKQDSSSIFDKIEEKNSSSKSVSRFSIKGKSSHQADISLPKVPDPIPVTDSSGSVISVLPPKTGNSIFEPIDSSGDITIPLSSINSNPQNQKKVANINISEIIGDNDLEDPLEYIFSSSSEVEKLLSEKSNNSNNVGLKLNIEKSAEADTSKVNMKNEFENPIDNNNKESVSKNDLGSLRGLLDSNIDSEKTVAIKNERVQEAKGPVVGWLVGLNSQYVGESFCLYAGKNNIGRSPLMGVSLSKEITISRDRHAIIVFDPDNIEFYIKPGDCDGLTYLNGSILLEVKKLNPRDKLKFGSCEMIFVPLCGPNFRWK